MNAGQAFRTVGSVIALCAAAVSPALAVDTITETWRLDYGAVPGVSSGGYASTVNYTYDGVIHGSGATGSAMKISGWWADDPGSAWVDASDDLRHWSGVGLDRSNDGHTIDNNGSLEFVALEFEVPVSLHAFQWGYVNGDSDTTIMYLDTANANFDVENAAFGTRASTSLTGTTRNDATTSPANGTIGTSLTNAGWDAIGDDPSVIWNPGTQYTVVSGDTADIFSYVWAVGASFFDGLSEHATWDGGKLKKITAKSLKDVIPPQSEPGVPVPATAALMALGVFFVRRRKAGVRFFYTSKSVA